VADRQTDKHTNRYGYHNTPIEGGVKIGEDWTLVPEICSRTCRHINTHRQTNRQTDTSKYSGSLYQGRSKLLVL